MTLKNVHYEKGSLLTYSDMRIQEAHTTETQNFAGAGGAVGDRLDTPAEEKQPTTPVSFSEESDGQPNDEWSSRDESPADSDESPVLSF